MKFWQKVWNNIKEPKGVWVVFASLLSVAAIVGAILMACLTKEQMWYNYIFYPFALVGLVYIIYLVIYFTPKVKPWITTKMSKYHFLDSMLHDYGYRAIFFAICSMAINVAFVVVMGFIAIKNRSFWFGTFAVYYILLTIMRALAVLTNKKSDRQKDLKTYLLTAIFLLLINIALTVMIFLILNKAAGARYEGLMVYISAVYTFYKLALAIYNMFKVKKYESLMVKAVKTISFTDAIVSILVLQVTLIEAFGTGTNLNFLHAVTGLGVSIGIIAMALFMILNYIRIKRNNIKEEE